ncbi:hypothetical protein CHS0354_013497 [Potamilus streckersoni]|uniref:Uncharacterized protein n=1 Tax=Potamilus streckersoni TaxID=2493646 RepID=A0AAE0W9Y5_9BIVA|nr:hypothetical protein CHS0354_013497 [Potamilus streckersoni]
MAKLAGSLCVLMCVICVSECLPWFYPGFAMPASGPYMLPPFQPNFLFAPHSHSSFEPTGSIGHGPLLEPGKVMHLSRPTTLIRTHGIHNLSLTLIRLPNNVAPAKPTAAEHSIGSSTTISPAQRSISSFDGQSLNTENTMQNLPQRNISIKIPVAHQQPIVPTSIFIQSHRSHPVARQVPQRTVVSLSVLPSVQSTSAKQTSSASFPQETVRGHDISQQTRSLGDQTEMLMQQIEKQKSLLAQPGRMPVLQTPVLTLNISLQDLLRIWEAMELERQNNELPVSVPRRQVSSNLQEASVPFVSQMSSGTDIGSLNNDFAQPLPTSSPLQETPVLSSRSNNKINVQSRSASVAEQFFSATSAPLHDVPSPIKSRRPSTKIRGQSGSANITVQFLSPTSATLQEVQGSVSSPWSSSGERGQSGATDTSIHILSPTPVHLQDANRPVISPRFNTRIRNQPGSEGDARQFVSPTLVSLQEVHEHVTSPWPSTRERGHPSSANTGSNFLQDVQEPALPHWSDNRILPSLSSSLRQEFSKPMISSGPNHRDTGQSGSRDTAVKFLSPKAASRQDVQEPVARDINHSGSPDIHVGSFSPNDRPTGGGAEMEQEDPIGGEEPPSISTQSSNINERQLLISRHIRICIVYADHSNYLNLWFSKLCMAKR